MTKTTEKTDHIVPPQQVLTEMQKAGFDNLAHLNVALLETFGDASAELARFIAQRISEDVKTQHEILHCKSFKDLQEIQMRFVQNAMDQYQESTAKLADIGTQALHDHLEENK